MTFDEFIKQFATEEQCRDYLYHLRWPEGFACPKCKEQTKAWLKARNVYECSLCRHQTSVIAGTVFQDTRKSNELPRPKGRGIGRWPRQSNIVS